MLSKAFINYIFLKNLQILVFTVTIDEQKIQNLSQAPKIIFQQLLKP